MKINKKHIPTFPQVKNKPKWIFIHNAYSSGTALACAKYAQTNYGAGVANFYVDDKSIWEVIAPNITAWHCGVYEINQQSIGIEICRDKGTSNAVYLQSEANALKLAAELCKKYKLNPKTAIRLHSEVFNTACPLRSKQYYGSYAKAKSAFITKVGLYMEGDTLLKPESFPWDKGMILLKGNRNAYKTIPTNADKAKKTIVTKIAKGGPYECFGRYTISAYKGRDVSNRTLIYTKVKVNNQYYFIPIYTDADSKNPDDVRFFALNKI